MRRHHIVVRTFASAAIVAGLGLSFPVVAGADTISDVYGSTYDRTEVYVDEDGSDGTEVAQMDEAEGDGIALYSAESLTPRSCSQEMLYFCAWESGQNYDQGLSWGDGYHAMGYFQFDNRYDLGTFLHAVYNYNPGTYSALKVIDDYYGWNVYGKDIRNSDGDIVEEGNITKVASPGGNGTIADDLNKAWHACYAANPAEFSQLQNGWAYDHYYVPAANYMRSRGLSIDDRSDSVKSLCWGMSNLFGTGGWRKFVGGWTSGYDWNGNWNDWAEWPGANLSSNMNDAEFVEALCDYVVDNVSVFYKAQPQYWDGWRNRYRGEKAHYLNALSTDGIVPVRNGEYQINGKWYYYVDGAMATGLTGLPDGRTVYYGDDGAMRYGEQLVDGGWYHFDEVDGSMSTGLTRLKDGRDVLYSDDGPMLYGLQQVAGRTYYFARPDGNMVRATWVSVDGSDESRYADRSGHIVATAEKTEDGYLFTDQNGKPLTGWQRFNETAFYCDSDGIATTGEMSIDGSWYHFDEDTAAMSTGITSLPDGRRAFYSTSGKMQYGQKCINGSWYYFDDNNGAMLFGWKYIDNQGKWVWYGPTNDTGKMRYGWQTVDGVQRYFDEATGACDKIDYQTPNGCHRVSTRNVSLPSYVGGGRFSYVTPSRIGVDASREDCIETMISRAYEYLDAGTPYIWDYSCAPGVGVDCAGLVMQCLYATGMDLGYFNPWDHYYTPGHDHYANDMWNDPQFVHMSFSERQRGDLICYPGHIAIYLGNDRIIEAASARVGLRVSSVYSSPNIKGVLRPFA